VLKILRDAWKIVDLRKKILFTLMIIMIFRIGSAITVPFVDVAVLTKAIEDGGTIEFLSMISGGGFSNASIFALSITPYINASIIIQLLTVAIPPLEKLAKDGEAGRKKLGAITRFVTVGLGLMLGIAYYTMVRWQYSALIPAIDIRGSFWTWFGGIVIVMCFTAGSTLMMWLGEQVNEKGIGSGISMLLFAGILSRIPSAAVFLWESFYTGGIRLLMQNNSAGLKNVILMPLVLVLFLFIIAFIIFMTDAERRIPIQYAKRVVGRKVYGGQNTYIPVKVNMSGVMPIILAVSLISVPSVIAKFAPPNPEAGNTVWKFITDIFSHNHPFYGILYFILIIGFAFFYVTIQYNPVEMANNLRKNSGAIPGYRPGRPTVDYIKRVLNKVTLIGALFLGFVALFPIVFGAVSGIQGLTIGGTSVMIVVGVAMETTQQLESQMMMRHYKGFLE